MKQLRLIFLVLLLVGGYSTFSANDGGCNGVELEEGGKCPKYEPRPNGCKCCSDNHCESGYCNPSTDKCATRP